MLETKVFTITPVRAKEWLEGHSNFRKLNKRRVAVFAADMESGNWDLNGESIKFDTDGFLIDGQHRLHACIKSMRSFSSVVNTGVTCIDNIDTGSKRQYADVLARRGLKNPTVLAAAVSWAKRLDQGNVTSHGGAGVSHASLDAFYEANSAIGDSVSLFAGRFKVCNIPASKGAALHYFFAKRDPEMAFNFFEAVTHGANLSATDPAFVLRSKLQKLKDDVKNRKVNPVAISAFTIKAWNCWRRGTQISRLSWVPFAPRNEGFPEII